MSPDELMTPDSARSAGAPSSNSRAARGLGGPSTRRRAAALVLVGLLGASTAVGSSASAAPTPTVAEVARKVEKLGHQAEIATERYLETKEQLKSVNVRLKAAQSKLERQRGEVVVARQQVGRLAAETYRRGELSTLDLVLGDDPDAVLAQAGYLPSLGERQAGAMKRLQEGEAKLAATEADILAQQKKAKAAKITMSKNKAVVERRLAQANAQLRTLRADQRQQLRQAQDSAAGVSGGSVSGGGGTANCNGDTSQAPSAAARTAINFACAQLGEPYYWGGAGPGSWDCSGLTMKAYAAANISLPHSSRMQAGYGTRVSNSALAPGDLVFFNSPISHVGIYLGGNKMVHAPHTGDVVRVATLYDTPVAAVRL